MGNNFKLKEMRQAFKAQQANAKDRGIDFQFSFTAWCEWWLTDDRWARKPDLVMARYGDKGPYRPDNVRPLTRRENALDHHNQHVGGYEAMLARRQLQDDQQPAPKKDGIAPDARRYRTASPVAVCDACDATGMTQLELADRLGVTDRQLRNYRTGETPMPFAVWYLLNAI